MSGIYPPQQTAVMAYDPSIKRSRNGRLAVGIGLLIVAALGVVGMIWLYAQFMPAVEVLPEDERSFQVVLAALSALQILAIFCTGIWNITARHSRTKAPLFTAAALSGLALVFATINAVDFALTLGKFPPLWPFTTHIAVLVVAIRVLRLRPAPAATQPAQEARRPT